MKFQPTRPLRGATGKIAVVVALLTISTHAPLTGRDLPPLLCRRLKIAISTHAPLTGRDTVYVGSVHVQADFNPRAPYGARQAGLAYINLRTNFNPRAPYGARRPPNASAARPHRHFNPRAPYGARLQDSPLGGQLWKNFNPRAPYGARPGMIARTFGIWSFQPTRPLRGATTSAVALALYSAFQPTRPLRGATAKMHK